MGDDEDEFGLDCPHCGEWVDEVLPGGRCPHCEEELTSD